MEKKNTIYILIAIACRLKISKSLLRANDPLIYIGDRREDTVRANSRICPHADKYGRGIVDDQPVRGAPGLFARTHAKIRRRCYRFTTQRFAERKSQTSNPLSPKSNFSPLISAGVKYSRKGGSKICEL